MVQNPGQPLRQKRNGRTALTCAVSAACLESAGSSAYRTLKFGKRTGPKPVSLLLKREQLCWDGHVCRMDTRRLVTKNAVGWNLEEEGGKLDRGRYRTGLKDAVTCGAESLGHVGTGSEVLEVTAQDRNSWRQVLAQLTE